jgi:hypothetical protein
MTAAVVAVDRLTSALVPPVIRLIWDVDGVVDVVTRLGEARTAPLNRR